MSPEALTRGVASSRFRRAFNITLITALLMMGVALIGTAEAGHVACGDVITTNTTLDSDVGPCPADGLIVRANNITLDLNGHRVFAAVPNGAPENAGIRLGMVRGVTVRNGTVEGFDAGVAIFGGGGNTITRITAQNNVNDMLEPVPWVPRPNTEAGEVHRPTPAERPLMECNFGDGITTFNSDDNLIERNQVIGNGPFGGITLVEDSDNNRVRQNVVEDSNISNRTTDFEGDPVNSLCGGTIFPPGMQRGRTVQGMGIRIEGPGADSNLVEDNRVDNSALVGISIHSYVCLPQEGDPRGPQDPNTQNLITGNRVTRTGAETAVVPQTIRERVDRGETVTSSEISEAHPNFDLFADGIASLAQGPIGSVTCTSPNNTIARNHSTDNLRNGILLGRTVEDTTVNDNVVQKNGVDGIRVELGAVNNTLHANRGHQNGVGAIYEFVREDHDNNPATQPVQVLRRTHGGEDRGHDGHDDNPTCDNNDWRRNRFGFVNQPCVAAGGTGWVGGPGKSGQAPGQQQQQDGGQNTARGPRG